MDRRPNGTQGCWPWAKLADAVDRRTVVSRRGSARRWGGRDAGAAADYAFAIWDAKRRRLVCARDAFGIRPLLFAQVGGGLAFASELAALLSLPGLRRQLNEERLAAYLVDDLEETGQTLFSGVSALPGGHLLVAEKSTVQVRRYWEPALEPSAILASDSDYAEGFRELFMEAIRCRMPVACEISIAASR